MLTESLQVYANDLDVAAEYLVRVTEEQLDRSVLGQSYFLDSEYEEARLGLESILSLQERYRAILKVCIPTIFTNLSTWQKPFC